MGTVATVGGLVAAGCCMAMAAGGRAAYGGAYIRSHSAPVILAAEPARSVVYDRDGHVLAILDAGQNRNPVPYHSIPRTLINAVVDTEDHAFFLHGAIDVRSLLRAASTDLASGQARQGGSTITQQLVKNTIVGPEKTLSRKMHEAVDAVRLQDTLTRRQILGDYLNTVYFGNGAYGVEAAAETYFGVPVALLRPAQSALLAGLIQDPGGYDPIVHPGAARVRRDTVLGLMATYHHLSRAEAARLSRAPLPNRVLGIAPPVGPSGYFLQEVTQLLLDDPVLGATAEQRYKDLYEGGLRITTTLDPAMESAATAALHSELPDTNGRFTGALVAIDPTSGAVRALANGTTFATAQYDIATGRGGSGRPVGSSFKPFVLLTALTEGWTPGDVIDGAGPCTIDVSGYRPYVAQNFEGEAFGRIDLASALAHSVNCAYLRLGATVGLSAVAAVAHDLGITSRLEPYPSLPLGTEELTPLQMASAYATIDDGGTYHAPYFVQRIATSAGRVLYRAPRRGVQVVPRFATEEAVAAMERVVTGGTGTAAALGDRVVAGKTGTTSNFADAWFVGFSAQLAAAVWMGSTSGEVPMTDVGGIAVAGGTYPARIWHDFMAAALAGAPALPLRTLQPAGGRLIVAPGYAHYLPYGQPIPVATTTTTSTPTTSTSSTTSTTSTTIPGAATTSSSVPASAPTTTTTTTTTTTVSVRHVPPTTVPAGGR
jgi:membrane peptidoglycan carboxypeptidase